MTHSYKNHVRFHDVGGHWRVSFGQVSRPIGSLKEEILATVKLIGDTADKELVLFFSGGIESEAILRACLEIQLKTKIWVIRYANNLNDYDIRYAINFCKSNNIDFDFIDIDIEKFVNDGIHEEMYKKYNCISVTFAIVCYLIEQNTDIFPILGGNAIYYAHEKDKWIIKTRQSPFAVHYLLEKQNRSGCPDFFHYTPELLHSYVDHPIFNEMINDAFPLEEVEELKYKSKIYKDLWPDIVLRPKYWGGEKYWPIANPSVYKTYRDPRWNDFCKFSVEEFKNSLVGISNGN